MLQLDKVVPWGRSAREYSAMFALAPHDLRGQILDCGGGPSSFTAELTAQGTRVIACDPLYQFSAAEIRRQIEATCDLMIALNEAHKDNFRWDLYGSPHQLAQQRLASMHRFLDDYTVGREQGRYVLGGLPSLPFPDRTFDLALCSHLLFTYSDQFSAEFHLASILELRRVATEVRIFPLLTSFSGQPSLHLSYVLERTGGPGLTAAICQVPYEFQKGGNRMLCLRNVDKEEP